RALGLERAAEIAERLARAGAPIDVAALVSAPAGQSGKSIARPQIARALIAAGHVATVSEAFDRFLSEGCCAFVPHRGPSPADAVAVVRESGGLASLAHPGTLQRDGRIPGLVESGLAAVEAYHTAHDAATTAQYVAVARTHDV